MRPVEFLNPGDSPPRDELPRPDAEVIDVHTHYVPHGWPDLGPDTPTARFETEAEVMIMMGDREFRRVASDCWDARIRLADMDADGVHQQVVSPTPVFFSY